MRERDAHGHGNHTHNIYLGTGENGWAWAGPQRSTLVLGPSRSGKTSSLVIPNLLLAEGPVVSTSTKPDVMEATAPVRVREGWAFLFDPSGEIECPAHVERVGWSPLTTAGRWDAAVQTSDAMVNASRLGGAGIARSPGEHHWTERASALLSPLLHAAALESLPMRTVVRWIDRHDGATPLQILSRTVGDDATATDLLAGIVGTDARRCDTHDAIRCTIALTTHTTSTSEEVRAAGRGRAHNGRHSCWGRHVRGRHPPWSYLIFFWPKGQLSPPLPSPM